MEPAAIPPAVKPKAARIAGVANTALGMSVCLLYQTSASCHLLEGATVRTRLLRKSRRVKRWQRSMDGTGHLRRSMCICSSHLHSSTRSNYFWKVQEL
ncbi:hypothetical protein F7725_007867 [Dissostichus mawsoni]|uniref:Uncharacterized protein n=1 Tax=Dissostichus mawsoni TaxID=36200 RepID=A0A7J5Y5J7_DISMA|nr:hypothetical protein F7725_007867 [Dissostichus mawsoni]